MVLGAVAAAAAGFALVSAVAEVAAGASALVPGASVVAAGNLASAVVPATSVTAAAATKLRVSAGVLSYLFSWEIASCWCFALVSFGLPP